MQGDLALLLSALVSLLVTAAFFEEMAFRGFLLGRLLDVFGPGNCSRGRDLRTGPLAPGAGRLLFGLFYVLQERNLWVQIIMHGVIDTLGLVQFYMLGVPALTS